VPTILDGSLATIEPVGAAAGLAAWKLTVQDRHELNAALDRLRSEAVVIESIEPMRSSLEEVFLRAIGGAEGTGS